MKSAATVTQSTNLEVIELEPNEKYLQVNENSWELLNLFTNLTVKRSSRLHWGSTYTASAALPESALKQTCGDGSFISPFDP
jgi:hypothetical protein